ncbi:MAG TPA: glutamine--fructose-6-phosphate aminotransferase, partial [Chromatiaceae bacterium]|nr:glutamine--fructose-6-phosphate aminotransferase [Chromatiaceae bacterium]
MCGIVGAVAERDVTPILVEGLKRLEYRGYDSAGIAVMADDATIARCRTQGKVRELENALSQEPLSGTTGIAHTRWATHGVPSRENAHPHVCKNTVALVHNGIIENFEALREQQKKSGHRFSSQTDTEVVVHQVYDHLSDVSGDLL